MLLKPATPLTILLLAAFALLLLSVISTPIVKGIPLATFENVDFGVFGYCKQDGCSELRIGYSTTGLFSSSSNDSDFDLPSSARTSLSSILVVHPIAAFLTFVCLCLAFAAHFHAPSHSPRYLLGLLILLLPTLLVSLLAFLVDILLFVPHLQWGGWIVLAATILLVTCGVVTCAMRRTLVSRKARKRRIAENAEMSGENYYNRQNALAASFAKADSPPPLSTETKAPLISGAPSSDNAPAVAEFDVTGRSTDDDRLPLNSRNANNMPTGAMPNDRVDRYGPSGPPGPPAGNQRPYLTRDEFGNPLPPPGPPYTAGPGMPPEAGDPRLRNQYSDSSMGSRRGPPQGPGPRGRGGYPPRGGYGRGGPYGGPRGPPPNGRGRPTGPMRGAPPGPGMMRGRGQRGPPPGYPQTRGGPPGGFGPYGPGPDPRPPPNFGGYVPDIPQEYDYRPRGPSPGGPMRRPPPGAVGMDMPPNNGNREVEAFEMTPQAAGPRPRDPYPEAQAPADMLQPQNAQVGQMGDQSPTSVYSPTEPYVPPRNGWTDNGPRAADPMPLNEPRLPRLPPVDERQVMNRAEPVPRPENNYYEDIEPKFAAPRLPASNDPVPSALVPGPPPIEIIPVSGSYDEIPEGARSPAASDVSHFTSISERGINPRWRPPPPPSRMVQQRREDILLEDNPDFNLRAGRGRGGGIDRGGRMPTLPSLRGDGRYPMP
ncbi:hypothetical protein DTO164E3_8718 [Paecilomyces variotii]|uniref:SUR7/PalI family-domain-containing protein n=1 Tax=Byssochlamys spectabilis TaxID=264951 RepID=A0A443I4W3_BYSSP|nr:SUR7/PalI family-domain-containing protein [Paecilomyces variotii]KAJ9191686.1 hypothetical protein DTO164E3_8718 [Paecilomyces variotii]KAJ9206985.1 hypothetical protein DTO032I3_1573 [Paecilomyces variotii]KAJ9281498.1 hypothetical protein DTO021D3_1721 [Paecilomyces variotii]KAJ9346440.1 hypothetical protein DTO027B6_694 [Paecilomyces variotii]KAJ9356343.1 hypothetical protein DTO027B9_3555 [Paecilomyces variotii]